MKNSRKMTEVEKKSWLVVLFCILAYTSVYVGRKNLSVCLPAMTEDGVISPALGGTVGTCFLIFYACGQLINGCLGDKFHPKAMICTGLMVAGIMNILMGLSSVGILFCVFWAVCGFACSMLWSPIVRAVSLWTTHEISLAAGVHLTTAIPLGTVVCYMICALCMKVSTWRCAFIVCGIILCAASAVVFLCFTSLKEYAKVPVRTTVSTSEKQPFLKVFSIGILFTALAIVFNGILKDGLDLWIPTVLNDRFIPDVSAVSLICSLLPIINISGAYGARFVFRKFKLDELSCCGVMFALSALCLVIVTAFISFTPAKSAGEEVGALGIVTAVFITILFAVSSAAMFGANTMLLTFIPLHYGKVGLASSVSGMLDCFSYAAAAVSNIAVGAVSEGAGWVKVFMLFVGCALVGLLISLAGHGKMKKTTDALDSAD